MMTDLLPLISFGLSLAGSYIAFAAVQGDPDVWDFYRGVWWLPLAVLGGLATVLWITRASASRTRHVRPRS